MPRPILHLIDNSTIIPKYVVKNGLQKVQPMFKMFTHHMNEETMIDFKKKPTLKTLFESQFVKSHVEFLHNQVLNNKVEIIRPDPKKTIPEQRQGSGLGRKTYRLSGKKIWTKVKLDVSDKIRREDHAHEPDVLAIPNGKIEIIHETDGLVVVNKPNGIPSKPMARFYYNTVEQMLKTTYGYAFLTPFQTIHKLTSGVVIFGKSSTILRPLKNNPSAENIEQKYLARVSGHFPEQQNLLCDKPLVTIDAFKKKKNVFKGSVTFHLIKYNPILNQSIVSCDSKGFGDKSIEIRIRLRNLGFPIVNDYTYRPNGLYGRIIKKELDLTEAEWEEYISTKHNELIKSRRELKEKGVICDECKDIMPAEPPLADLKLDLHLSSYQINSVASAMKFQASDPDWVEFKSDQSESSSI